MKIQIGICNDEERIATWLERTLRAIFYGLELESEIHCYPTGESLCKALEADIHYDLLFLDIDLPPGCKNGIALGKLIRDVYEDNTVAIIYTSWKTKYSLQLFDTQPFHFLVKPLTYKQVETVLKRYLKVAKPWPGEFTYKIDHSLYRVRRKDIVYLESSDRKIILHLADGRQETFYGALKEVYEEQLKMHDFLFTHAAYVVNYNYIAKFNYKEVTLTTKDPPLPISQPKRKAVREAYLAISKRREG